MPPATNSFLSQIAAIWNRLQAPQRATVALFALLVFGSLGTLVFFMNRVDYVVLYRDLNPEDAQAIAARLKELKQDYRVSADASMIEVAGSEAAVDKLRLEVAGSGLARSGRVGYEIFDQNQFGMTDFTEQVNYKRALEGELGRTISSISEVLQARVHLVLPKDSIFEDQKEDAKASVLIRLKSGRNLSDISIAGIVNLVAGAVQGLKTNNISVVDENGKVLSRLSQSAEGIRSDLESGVQAQIEKEMTDKVVSILEPVVGKGRVHANASVQLDFNSSEQTEETYNPNPPVILSQQKSEEHFGGSLIASGIPGTRSNVGEAEPTAPETAPEQSRKSEVTNYEVSKLVRHTVQPKGTIRRISVAVILDHKAVYSKDPDGTVEVSYQPRSEQELDAYRELVLAAVGYEEERGDTVTLENMPFFNELRTEEEEPVPVAWYIRFQPYLIPAMKYAALITLFLLAYLILIRPVRKRVFQSFAAMTAIQEGGKGGEISKSASGQALEDVPSGRSLPAGPLAEENGSGRSERAGSIEDQIEQDFLRETQNAEAGFKKYDILKRRVVEHATRDPEQVSQLIRTWIHERP